MYSSLKNDLFSWGFTWRIFLSILFPPMHATRPAHYNFFGLSIFILGKPFKFPTLVATRSKALICGRSLAGIVGSNSAGDIDSSELYVLR
jgi:hypothetical protein